MRYFFYKNKIQFIFEGRHWKDKKFPSKNPLKQPHHFLMFNSCHERLTFFTTLFKNRKLKYRFTLMTSSRLSLHSYGIHHIITITIHNSLSSFIINLSQKNNSLELPWRRRSERIIGFRSIEPHYNIKKIPNWAQGVANNFIFTICAVWDTRVEIKKRLSRERRW